MGHLYHGYVSHNQRVHFANICFILSIASATVWNKNELSCCTAVSFLCWNVESIFKSSLLVMSSLLLTSIHLMFVDSPLATIDQTQSNTHMHAQYINIIYIYAYFYIYIYILLSYMTTCFAYTCLIWLVASTLQLNLSGPMQIIASTNHGCLSAWANESPLTNFLVMVLYHVI